MLKLPVDMCKEMLFILKCFPWLFVFQLSAVLAVRASVPVTTVYAVAGMPRVQLPCSAIHHVNSISPHEIELMWARKEEGKTDWRIVVVNDKDGSTETFRQPILGVSTFANTSQKNEQFYGRVNVTQPYGNLVISQVKIKDAGQFSCRYKVYRNRSEEHDESIAELIVEAPVRTGTNCTCPGNATSGTNNNTGDGNGAAGTNNTTGDGNGAPGNPNNDKYCTCHCTIWKTLFGVTVGFLILLSLCGVMYKICPAYCKREQSILLVGDGSPRGSNASVIGNGTYEEETSIKDIGDNGNVENKRGIKLNKLKANNYLTTAL